MLLVDAVLFYLEVVRLDDVVHQVKVLMKGLLAVVVGENDCEQLDELLFVVLAFPLALGAADVGHLVEEVDDLVRQLSMRLSRLETLLHELTGHAASLTCHLIARSLEVSFIV